MTGLNGIGNFMQIVKVAVLSFLELPKDIQKSLRERENYGNDIFMEMQSELGPEDCTIEGLQTWYKESEYAGTFESWIEDWALQFEYWIAQQNYNLEDVDQILIEISW